MHDPDLLELDSGPTPHSDAIKTTRSLAGADAETEAKRSPADDGAPPTPGGTRLKCEVLLSKMFPTEVKRPSLGRYDVLEFVGEGGMGTVYSAHDPRLDRKVAIKMLRNATSDPQRRARLVLEAKALARLSHSNVVTVHEVWDEGGELYIAMEFVEGDTLAQWQRSSRSWREILGVYLQAGEGLVAVHDAGLVVRDFKPANAIRREEDGVVKLLDFGLARLEQHASTAADQEPEDHERASTGSGSTESHGGLLTRPGTMVGTPAYMAPEQFKGATADARSDQFSFAVSLWEALFGQRPFERKSPLYGALMGEPRVDPPRDHGVPAWLQRVVDRSLATDPQDRYPSMREMLRALRADPVVRRRRVLGALALATVTVAGGLVVAELRAEPPTTCVEVSPTWDDVQRRAAQAGVTEAAGATAEQTWDLLAPRLDHHAQMLVELRRDACESHRRGLLPDEHYALQVACLERGQAGLSELVEQLGKAEPSAVANANKAVMQLPPPSACIDIDALTADHPPPTDTTLAAAVAEQRQQLARASTEESLGLYARAAERADGVLERAEQLSYPPLRAEALLRRGSARMQADQPEAADDLDQSLWLSLTTEQRRVAAEAAAKRIFVHGDPQLGDRDVGEVISLARSLSDRSGAADWSIRWALSNNIGIALDARAEPQQALGAFERALAQLPGGDDDDDIGRFERSTTLMNMAGVQQRLGHPDQAIDSNRRAIEEIVAVFGPTHPQVRETRMSLARVYRFAGRFAEASGILDDVLAQFTDPASAPAAMLFEGAEVARQRGDLDLALARIEQGRSKPESDLPPMWRNAFAAMHASVAAARGDATVLEELRRDRIDIGAERRAEVLIVLRRFAEAEALMSPIVDGPESSTRAPYFAALLLGRALVGLERFADAEQRLRPLVEAADLGERLGVLERARALRTLAAAEAGQGRSHRAAELAQRAVEALAGFDRDCVPVREALEQQAAIESLGK